MSFIILSLSSVYSQVKGISGQEEAFSDRFMAVPLKSGFQMENYHVWCGSVIKGEDGRYYMFASRWPEGEGYDWVLDSEVVLASSDTPTGPYKYERVVLPKRGTKYWDGMMTHNPTIHKYKDTYLLYYTGTTFAERSYALAWNNKRIGLATATSVKGPWTRLDAPLLNPRPGKWDNQITSNAAPCIMPDGRVILVYKSTKTGFWTNGHFDFDLRLGVAVADNYSGPYQQISDEPILTFSGTKDSNAEDAYIWYDDEGFHMFCKVFDAGISLIGEKGGGIHAVSKDGIQWELAKNPKGYSRTITWENGTKETLRLLERPQLLIEDGMITHAIFAVAGENGKLHNIVIPLKH
jgi:hypothetical protein